MSTKQHRQASTSIDKHRQASTRLDRHRKALKPTAARRTVIKTDLPNIPLLSLLPLPLLPLPLLPTAVATAASATAASATAATANRRCHCRCHFCGRRKVLGDQKTTWVAIARISNATSSAASRTTPSLPLLQ
eukprot:1145123-Pleurochrysis_carterae.AAC.2